MFAELIYDYFRQHSERGEPGHDVTQELQIRLRALLTTGIGGQTQQNKHINDSMFAKKMEQTSGAFANIRRQCTGENNRFAFDLTRRSISAYIDRVRCQLFNEERS